MADEDKNPQQAQTIQIALMAQDIRTLTLAVNEMSNRIQRITDDHEDRIREIEAQVATLKERLTVWQIFQVVFTSAVGGVAAFFKRP